MPEKISCGGFIIDNESLVEQDGVLRTNFAGNKFVITITSQNDSWKSDKECEEIEQALDDGKQVVCILGNTEYVFCGATRTVKRFDFIRATLNSSSQQAPTIISIWKIFGNTTVAVQSCYFLPKIDSSVDINKTLVIDNNGRWAVKDLTPFNVALTPNSAVDLSGTMDKTISEIYEAWQSGRRIIFNVSLGEKTAIVEATLVSVHTSYTYPSFEAYIIDPSVPAIMYACTEYSDNGEANTYATTLYQLAPVT